MFKPKQPEKKKKKKKKTIDSNSTIFYTSFKNKSPIHNSCALCLFPNILGVSKSFTDTHFFYNFMTQKRFSVLKTHTIHCKVFSTICI